MTWNVLQSAGSPGASTGLLGVSFGSNLSSGSKIICYIANNDTTITSVKDTAGNSLKIHGPILHNRQRSQDRSQCHREDH